LRQATSDPLLKRYDVIIIDEVHERHIFGDFLLGILKQLIQTRPQLKLSQQQTLFCQPSLS
jgi:HrpA-like RNA helicase